MKQFTPLNPNFRQRVQDSFKRQEFMNYISASLAVIEPGYCEIHVPYRDELTQQHGFFHGGVIGTVADNCAGYAAFSLMDARDSVLSVEFKLNLIAPGDGKLLISRGKVIRPGRTLTVCQMDVFVVKNRSEKQCATALATIMALKGKSDTRPIS